MEGRRWSRWCERSGHVMIARRIRRERRRRIRRARHVPEGRACVRLATPCDEHYVEHDDSSRLAVCSRSLEARCGSWRPLQIPSARESVPTHDRAGKDSRAVRHRPSRLAWQDRGVITVPTYIPSYDLSGDTHHVALGDHVVWQLSLIDVHLPECLLETVRATAEPADPIDPPYYWTEAHKTGSYVRHGGFVAWSHIDHAPVRACRSALTEAAGTTATAGRAVLARSGSLPR